VERAAAGGLESGKRNTSRQRFASGAKRRSDAVIERPKAAFRVKAFGRIVSRRQAPQRGRTPPLATPLTEPVGSEREQRVALVLEHVWFACLLGWVSGLHPVKTVTERMRDAVSLLLEQP
jgi:hypothetical protein